MKVNDVGGMEFDLADSKSKWITEKGTRCASWCTFVLCKMRQQLMIHSGERRSMWVIGQGKTVK